MNVHVPALLIALLAIGSAASGAAPAPQESRFPIRDGFARVDPPVTLRFPGDHGAHPEFAVEWWYLTACLTDSARSLHTRADRRFAVELVFFRTRIGPVGDAPSPAPASRWATDQILLAHAALTDDATGRFRFAERTHRAFPGLAWARGETTGVEALSVAIEPWRLVGNPEGTLEVAARCADFAFELSGVARAPVLLEGPGGLSRKGPGRDQASYYASVPDVALRGAVTTDEGRFEVSGTGWFDHEFSTDSMDPEASGWDWGGLRLSDGTRIMFYRMRGPDGRATEASSATLVSPNADPAGSLPVHLNRSSFTLAPAPPSATSRPYPAGFRLEIPSHGLSLDLHPWNSKTVLDTRRTTRVRYFEGPIDVRGTRRGAAVTGEGFLEMTGYEQDLGGRF